MLAGRFEASAARCRDAIEAARSAGVRRLEAHALNTLGVCLAAMGHSSEGEAALRESMAMAREDGDHDAVLRAYCNLADALFLTGRDAEARELAAEGIAELSDLRECRWLTLMLSEILFSIGDWAGAEAYGSQDELLRTSGTVRVNFLVRRAELLLGRGEVDAAIALLEEADDRTTRSLEPQWHGPIAALLAEAYRRARRYDAARCAVET